MTHADHRHGAGECPACGQLVDLERHGDYRRHFAVGLDGHRRLCVGSGRRADGVVRLLSIEPTPAERSSHTLRLFRGA